MAKKIIDCDLVVLGAGGSGLVAAVKAAELSGKKVVVLEKAKKAGKHAGLMDKANALLEVGPEIVTDKTHFTQNPQLLHQRRIAIAEMIESLR